jgi:hypothetical protein
MGGDRKFSSMGANELNSLLRTAKSKRKISACNFKSFRKKRCLQYRRSKSI